MEVGENGEAASRRGQSSAGAVLVETAIIISVLVLFVFGVIDFGRVYHLGNRLSGAAQVGAAYAQYHPTAVSCPGDDITDHAMGSDADFVTDTGLVVTVAKVTSGGTSAITGCNTNAVTVSPGDRVRVTVTHHFQVYTPVVAAIVGSDMVISRTEEVVVQG
jgi:Flp pilus assembly protein TadG